MQKHPTQQIDAPDDQTALTPAWEVYERYRQRQRLSSEQIRSMAGLSKNGLYNLNKPGYEPKPKTLRRIARALATDPYQRNRVDDALEAEAFHALFVAVGYPISPLLRPESDPLITRFRAVFGERADVFEQFIEGMERYDADDRSLAVETLGWLVKRVRAGQRSVEAPPE